MSDLKGFWSYVHADDHADSGRISRLASDIKDQYQMLTGDTISLFLDKDAIKWGDLWREEINSNLASTAFLIPVLTPRYFMRPECRRELQYITRKAINLGLKNIILPLLYVDVPALHEETPADDLIALVGTFQREDWRDMRFLDVTSEGYRRGVFRLTTRLVEANRQTEKTATPIVPLVAEVHEMGIDDSPGIIDKLAISEETLPKLSDTLQAIAKEIEHIGQFTQEAVTDIQRGKSQGKGFASTLLVARRVAVQMGEPTEHIWSLSNEYASQLHKVDEGIRTLIERAPVEIQENPNSKKSFCDFFESVRKLSASARDGLTSVQSLINSSEPLEKMSRDLRPVVRRLRQGLTILVESRAVSDEWVHLIESSGIVCEGAASQA